MEPLDRSYELIEGNLLEIIHHKGASGVWCVQAHKLNPQVPVAVGWGSSRAAAREDVGLPPTEPTEPG
jgi:hypothetical protein